MESISGTVVRVLKRNEDTGNVFLVVRYESMGGLVEAKMGCKAADLREGDWFSADGTWRTNVYRGKAEEIFNARSVRPDLPATKEGAREFFSRIFNQSRHGVTSDLTRRFAEVHGDGAARAAEDDPELLMALSMRPRECRDAILKDWGRRVSGRRAVSLMERSGVDERAIRSILGALRDRAWGMLRENPYRVSRIRDVGFQNADRIGRHVGLAAGDDRRVSAALVELLHEVGGEGHTYAPLRRIIDTVPERLSISAETVADFLSRVMSQGGDFVVDRIDGELAAQLPELYRAELQVAGAVARLMDSGRRNDRTRASAAVGRVMSSPRFSKLDEVQRRAILMAASEPISVITGGPGTGKSTIVEAIVEVAESLGESDILLVAPTGMASKRLGVTSGRRTMTMHRLLRARRDELSDSSVFELGDDNTLPPGCLVVVDELSMADVVTMAALLVALPPDGRLLVVGDKHQLRSVSPGNVLGDILAAKRPDGSVAVPSVELENVYRTKRNSAIATGAAEIKQGRLPYLDNRVRNGLVLFENEAEDIAERIVALVTGPLRSQLGYDPVRDVSVLCPQAPGSAGTWDINRRLSAALNPNGRTIEGIFHSTYDDRRMPLPRTGDRVMLTDNDDPNELFNGETGTLVDVVERKTGNGRGRRFLKVAFDGGKTVEYPVSRWRDLILAYAGTVHKAQGSQNKCVVLVATSAHERMLERQLLYTGWTRAEDLLVLIGDREALETAVSTDRSAERRTRLRSFLEAAVADARVAPDGRGDATQRSAAKSPAQGFGPSLRGLPRRPPPSVSDHPAAQHGKQTDAGMNGQERSDSEEAARPRPLFGGFGGLGTKRRTAGASDDAPSSRFPPR